MSKSTNFEKRYKFHSGIDEYGNQCLADNQTSDGVDYTGRVRKKIFSKEIYFSGEWTITVHYKDADNLNQIYLFHGTWKTTKVQ